MDDLSEREQLDAIKKWWSENGKAIVAGLIIGLGAVFGWQYWQRWQDRVAEEASALYSGVAASTGVSSDIGSIAIRKISRILLTADRHLRFSAGSIGKSFSRQCLISADSSG